MRSASSVQVQPLQRGAELIATNDNRPPPAKLEPEPESYRPPMAVFSALAAFLVAIGLFLIWL